MDRETPSFSERLTGAQLDLFAFISILMRGAGEAADVLQETNLVLLKNESNYDPSRPFMLWARGVARKCVLKFYSARSHEKLVMFDDALINSLAEQIPNVTDEWPHEDLSHLEHCMGRLMPGQREVVTARYMRGETVREIASRRGCSDGAISVMLHRVRQLLAECMQKERKRLGAHA